MKHAFSSGRLSVVIVGLVLLAGCKDPRRTASTSTPGGKVLQATCDSSGADYGMELGVAMEKQLTGADGLRNQIRDAVVTSCKEDSWDSDTLGCLVAAAEYKQRNNRSTSEACVKGLPAETQARMDDRVKRAITQ